MRSSDFFLCILAILFPPLPVWVKRGICSPDSVINILLCMLGLLPGLIHAWFIISKYPEPYEYSAVPQGDAENGSVTYYYVSHRSAPSDGPSQQNQNYGTAESMPPALRLGQDGDEVTGQSSSAAKGVPPSYEQAIKGDHKVQTGH